MNIYDIEYRVWSALAITTDAIVQRLEDLHRETNAHHRP